MSLFLTLIGRDLRGAFGRGGGLLPVAFFLLVATLYPFAVGPNPTLLAKTGGGVLWVAALLASILPVERLFLPDAEAGFIDQLVVRGWGEELIALAKLFAHWLSFGPPLMIAAIPAAALLRLDGAALYRLELGLAAGTPGLAALAVMIGAITASLRGASALGGLLLLPLSVPILIFGAGSLARPGDGGLQLLIACSLLACAAAPFVAGAALRAARE